MVEFLRRSDPAIPQVLINKNRVTVPKECNSEGFDLEILGDCDYIVELICDLLGWKLSDGDENDRSSLSTSVDSNAAIAFEAIIDDEVAADEEGERNRIYLPRYNPNSRQHQTVSKSSLDGGAGRPKKLPRRCNKR